MIEQDNQWSFTITSVGYSLASATLYTGIQHLHLPAHCCSASALWGMDLYWWWKRDPRSYCWRDCSHPAWKTRTEGALQSSELLCSPGLERCSWKQSGQCSCCSWDASISMCRTCWVLHGPNQGVLWAAPQDGLEGSFPSLAPPLCCTEVGTKHPPTLEEAPPLKQWQWQTIWQLTGVRLVLHWELQPAQRCSSAGWCLAGESCWFAPSPSSRNLSTQTLSLQFGSNFPHGISAFF